VDRWWDFEPSPKRGVEPSLFSNTTKRKTGKKVWLLSNAILDALFLELLYYETYSGDFFEHDGLDP
jgi:hypothetical protein